MAHIHKPISKQAGLAPGTLVHTGAIKREKVDITVVDYSEQTHSSKRVTAVSQCVPFQDTDTKTWINVHGLHQIDLIRNFGEKFHLHPLILEDIVHTTQRPKLEDHEQNLFAVMKMLTLDESRQNIHAEQISFILGKTYVITFQERPKGVFDPLRDRIRIGKGRMRQLGMDYLLYAIMDCVVDHYFIILEKMGEQIETLQDEIAEDPSEKTLQEIHNLKREMMVLRKAFWPAREMINDLLHNNSDLLTEDSELFFRDLYDHIIRVIETTEMYREMVTGMLEVYLSLASNKMNAVM